VEDVLIVNLFIHCNGIVCLSLYLIIGQERGLDLGIKMGLDRGVYIRIIMGKIRGLYLPTIMGLDTDLYLCIIMGKNGGIYLCTTIVTNKSVFSSVTFKMVFYYTALIMILQLAKHSVRTRRVGNYREPSLSVVFI
jgi:hypothetical protein